MDGVFDRVVNGVAANKIGLYGSWGVSGTMGADGCRVVASTLSQSL